MAKKIDFEIPDEKVLSHFFEHERRKILVILQSRLGLGTEDAEDIYQNSCIALFQNIHAGKLDNLTASLSTYFTSICLNQAKKFLRDRHSLTSFDGIIEQTQQDEYSASQIELILGLSESDITAEQKKMMRDIVQDLPSPCEEILWAYYGDNLSMKEIAPLVGYSNADGVKARKSQCMSKLKERFEKLKSLFYDND